MKNLLSIACCFVLFFCDVFLYGLVLVLYYGVTCGIVSGWFGNVLGLSLAKCVYIVVSIAKPPSRQSGHMHGAVVFHWAPQVPHKG